MLDAYSIFDKQMFKAEVEQCLSSFQYLRLRSHDVDSSGELDLKESKDHAGDLTEHFSRLNVGIGSALGPWRYSRC